MMTIEAKYNHILLAMGELLQQKEDKIFLLECEVRSLKEQLKKAEQLLQKSDSEPLMKGAN